MVTKKVDPSLQKWVCGWCFQWNKPEDICCHRCGRDLEYPKWSRVPLRNRKSDN